MVNTTLPQGGSKQIGHTAASQRAQTQECFKHEFGWMLVMPRTWGWIKARCRGAGQGWGKSQGLTRRLNHGDWDNCLPNSSTNSS